MQFPWGPLAPDAGDTARGVNLVADGVLPAQIGYQPMPGPLVPSGAAALAGAPRGVLTLIKNDGTTQVYAWTASTLYRLSADYGTWTSIATGYACPDGDDWSAVHFGSYLLFTNTVDGLLAYDVEAGSGPTSITAAGKPRFIFRNINQVVGVDCEDSSGSRNNRLIRASALNDHTNWTNRGSDYQPLEGGGRALAGVPLSDNIAVLHQELDSTLIEFGDFGSGRYFRLMKAPDGVGAVGAKSCVGVGGFSYFVATDGFKRISAGNGIEHIGKGRIDQWFLSRADQSTLDSVSGAYDPFNAIVWWRYKTQANASSEVFTVLIGYSPRWDKWVTATVGTGALTRIATPGYTLDALTTAYGTLGAVPGVLGSRFFQGGQPLFAIINADRKVAFFTGGNLAATLETAVANSPVTTLIGRCTGIDDAPGTVQLGTTDDLDTALTWRTAASKGRGGRYPLRGRGMNIAFRRNIAASATWSYAHGIDHVKGAAGGPS